MNSTRLFFGRLLITYAVFALAITFSLSTAAQTVLPLPSTYAFVHGKWFDGRGFHSATFYSVNNTLTRRKPAGTPTIMDLHGGFVVPPFADAHCHNFDSSFNIDEQVRTYLQDGVFYAKVQTDVRSGALEVASRVNNPSSVDVSYAHGALTSSFGHGVEIYEGLALQMYGRPSNAAAVTKIRASHLREDDAYYVIDSAASLEEKWPMVLAGHPDFLKVYLLTSEEFAERSQRQDTVGDRGLNPQLIPAIVEKAHAAALRVSAHVDTITDYRIALHAGVDEMAHLPGYAFDPDFSTKKYSLTEADAAESGRRGIWVILAPVLEPELDSSSKSFNSVAKEKIDAVRSSNVHLLQKHHVNLAFGSDYYGRSPVADVNYLHEIHLFSNAELLRIWSQESARTIFPTRKIGRLAEGYESSFLVLDGDPLKDFSATRKIKIRFKQGHPLELAPLPIPVSNRPPHN